MNTITLKPQPNAGEDIAHLIKLCKEYEKYNFSVEERELFLLNYSYYRRVVDKLIFGEEEKASTSENADL